MSKKRYPLLLFRKDVGYYSRILRDVPGKEVLVFGKATLPAYYSIAALSRACHDQGKTIYVHLYMKETGVIPALMRLWDAYANKTDREVVRFSNLLSKSAKDCIGLLERPKIILQCEEGGFSGSFKAGYKYAWLKKRKHKELESTAKNILLNCYALKKHERFGIGFELIPTARYIGKAIEDYLDSYQIISAFIAVSSNMCDNVTISASTNQKKQLDFPEKISELHTTLLGPELEKKLPIEPFKTYRNISKKLRLDKIRPNDAVFAIHGKGYHGRHIFGERIGYPTENLKAKWDSPGGIIYKFPWYPQSEYETRDPKSRVAFTETLPIDVFIDSANVDYSKLRDRNKAIADILRTGKKVVVESSKSCFEVGLEKPDGTKRKVSESDSDVRTIINQKEYEKTGKKYGRMANIPGGEAFVTPEYVKGKIFGDVVVSIDKSYRLSSRTSLVILAEGTHYKIISGPKNIIKKIQEKKKESWEKLAALEKSDSMTKNIIELKKKNFERIGEFAINTNPNARLCDYLIVNEKIANMIHIALGSGFEADRATEYHMDIVIDAPKQKLDIYVIDETGKKNWILCSGKFKV